MLKWRPTLWMKLVAILVCALAAQAEPMLLVHDAAGALLRQAPAVLRTEGRALVAREALFGAASALLIDDSRTMHTVAWIVAEDRDSGVVELFVGRQAPRGPDAATGDVTEVRSGSHTGRPRELRFLGGFGAVARLDCSGGDEISGPLYDVHGFLAGWHAVKTVDGKTMAFAIPLARVDEGLAATGPLSLPEWNRRRKAEADEIYSNALGHLWADDYEGAAFYWRKDSELEPDNARAWYHRAFMEGKTGHTAAKTRCFRKAIELKPNFADAHYNLAIGLALAGDREGAEAELKALQGIDPMLAQRLEGFLGVAHSDALPPRKKATHTQVSPIA